MRAGGEAGSGRVVVVPERPGRLIPVDDPSTGRAPDDLDALIDDLLPDVADGPGRADLVLVVAGGIAAAVGILGGPGWLVAAGLGAVGLGVVLPARALWRAWRERWRARSRASALRGGVALDVSTPESRALVDAYEDVWQAIDDVDPAVAGAALAAAHRAVLEVATLCDGPPAGADLAYLRLRRDAIRALAAELRRVGAGEAAVTGEADEQDGRSAVVAARDEVDRLSGTSTVDDLRQLAAEVRDGRR